jgi:hypothetical protein
MVLNLLSRSLSATLCEKSGGDGNINIGVPTLYYHSSPRGCLFLNAWNTMMKLRNRVKIVVQGCVIIK